MVDTDHRRAGLWSSRRGASVTIPQNEIYSTNDLCIQGLQAYKNRKKNSSGEIKAGIMDEITFELGLNG